MDALLIQREITQTIVDGHGDCICVVKDNHPHLSEDMELLFTPPPPRSRLDVSPTAASHDPRHGRTESHQLLTTTALNDYLDWTGVQQVFQLMRSRTIKQDGGSSEATVYGITCLSTGNICARKPFQLIRQHWAIGNQVHWARGS